jgi:hypothetical protein
MQIDQTTTEGLAAVASSDVLETQYPKYRLKSESLEDGRTRVTTQIIQSNATLTLEEYGTPEEFEQEAREFLRCERPSGLREHILARVGM